MKRTIFIVIAAVILGAAIWLAPWPLLRFWAGFFFLWFLPGFAWIPVIKKLEIFDNLESVFLALGLNFSAVPFITLLVVYLPGQNSRVLFFLLFSLVILLPLSLLVLQSYRKGPDEEPLNNWDLDHASSKKWWKTDWVWLLLVLLLASAMRLIYLGYSEFQGDEAAVLVRAAQIMTGEDAVLFQHKKGPLELLLPMAGWDIAGITNEWMSRLPFALASILGIGVVFLFGRRINTIWVAVTAASLMAVEGYLVGFGRIVQYQSVVVLLSSLALFCLLIYQQKGHHFLIVLAALFFGVGSWAHYDVILFLPAGLFLILWRLKADGASWRAAWPYLLGAGVLGFFIAAIFYIPFFNGSQAEGTLFYVSGRIGSDQNFYNHLPSTLNRTFVYDSLYLLILIFAGLVFQILFTWRQWSKWAMIAALFFILAFSSTLIFPQWWEIGDWHVAWVLAAIILFGSLMAPNQKPGNRALWLWFGVPAMFYLYFVAVPLTHVYTAVPGIVLLAGLGIYNFCSWISQRSNHLFRLSVVVAAILFILSTNYVIMTFVNHSPEYIRGYNHLRSTLYWTPFQDQLPEEGLFGFPYQAGWKTIGYLMDSGELNGSYDSNEERDVTDFYMRGAMRFDCATPDFYVIANNVQDEVAVRFDQIEAEYQPQFIIEVDGRQKSTILSQGLPKVAQTLPVQNYNHLYDLETTPQAVASASPAMVGQKPEDFLPAEATVGDFATLIGYKLDTENAHPGGYIELTLLWQAIGNAPIDYQVFTHLHDGQMMRGQLDGQPVCNSAPTSRWLDGSYIVDPYRIPILPDAAAGPVPLTVGMYDLATLQRVAVVQPSHPERADSIFIDEVNIFVNE